MDRRTLLKLMAATALAGTSPHNSASGKNSSKEKVLVVGAGIIGASIAYQLAKAGAEVTIIDSLAPASHASQGTFAWINATWAKQPKSYHALNQESVASWGQLQNELGLNIRWGGSLEWFASATRQDKLELQIAEQIAWGEPARMMSASEFKQHEPQVNFQGQNRVAYSPNDGAIDPVAATHSLLKAAVKLGAKLTYPCKLLELSFAGGRLVGAETSLGGIAIDKVVLATGAAPDTASRFAGLDLPQRSTPGIIAITKPMPQLLNGVISAPGIHMHQRTDGRIVLGEQSGPPKNEAHKNRLKGRPNGFPSRELAAEHATRMFAVAEVFCPKMAGLKIEDVHIGWRPLPLDGHPVIGASVRQPNVYLAVMHSGVSLAPIVGQLVAYELMSGKTVPRLDAYRPDRPFKRVKRY